jgi:RNA polymerase sigma factor (sigma-70 family)
MLSNCYERLELFENMKHSERLEIFEKVRADYSVFLLSVLWKLTGDKELFIEAMQYALLIMWQNVEKLKGEKAGGYIYRIALSANSRAWRNRIGKDGHFHRSQISDEERPVNDIDRAEQAEKVRKAISLLPAKQGKAIVMRYLEQQDYESIAGKLRCSRAGARSHVSKALATLKKKLKIFSELEV